MDTTPARKGGRDHPDAASEERDTAGATYSPTGASSVVPPAPDGGYALRLARHLSTDFALDAHEDDDDAVWLVGNLAARRAGLLGRAPSRSDVEFIAALLGYDGSAPDDFRAWRGRTFQGIERVPELYHALADAAAWALDRRSVPSLEDRRRWWGLLQRLL